jgi:hypothetical protein
LTLKIASREENSARATPTTQGIFFTQVGAITAYFGLIARAADAHLSGTAVNFAVPGTHIADRKMFVCPANTIPEFTAAQELQVGQFKRIFFAAKNIHHHLPFLQL